MTAEKAKIKRNRLTSRTLLYDPSIPAISMADILNKEITILDAQPISTKYGEAMACLLVYDGSEYVLIVGALALVQALKRAKDMNLLPAETKITTKKSKTGRVYYVFE